MLVQRSASTEKLARYRRIRVDRVHLDLAPGSAGRAREVASATVDLEVVDALTGDRLAAAVARRPARDVTASMEEGLAEAEYAIDEWARDPRLWLDDVMGA